MNNQNRHSETTHTHTTTYMRELLELLIHDVATERPGYHAQAKQHLLDSVVF